MLSSRYIAAITALFVNTGCFVDLDREDEVLRIFVEGASLEAEDVVVEVEDDSGLDPFVGRFELTEAAKTSGPPALALPDLSLVGTNVTVTAYTFDEQNEVIDGPVRESVTLSAGGRGLSIDFRAPPPIEPPVDTPPAPGDSVFVDTFSISTRVAPPPALVGEWTAEIRIEPATWDDLLAAAEGVLGGPASSLRIQHVAVDLTPGQASELGDLWDSFVTVRVQGGSVDAAVLTLDIEDLAGFRSPTLDVDVSAWASPLPSDARIEVSGIVADDNVAIEAQLTASVEIVATRQGGGT